VRICEHTSAEGHADDLWSWKSIHPKLGFRTAVQFLSCNKEIHLQRLPHSFESHSEDYVLFNRRWEI